MTFLQVYMGIIEFCHVFCLFCSGSFSGFCLNMLVTSLPSWLETPRLLLGQNCHNCASGCVPSRCSLFPLFSSFNSVFSLSQRACVLGPMTQSWDRFQRLPGPHQARPVWAAQQKSRATRRAPWLPQLWASRRGRGQLGCGPVLVGATGWPCCAAHGAGTHSPRDGQDGQGWQGPWALWA